MVVYIIIYRIHLIALFHYYSLKSQDSHWICHLILIFNDKPIFYQDSSGCLKFYTNIFRSSSSSIVRELLSVYNKIVYYCLLHNWLFFIFKYYSFCVVLFFRDIFQPFCFCLLLLHYVLCQNRSYMIYGVFIKTFYSILLVEFPKYFCHFTVHLCITISPFMHLSLL